MVFTSLKQLHINKAAGSDGIPVRLISREQNGFLACRSCVTQLTSVLHYIGGQLDAGKQIDIIYVDMIKAFDKVDHTKSLGRLHWELPVTSAVPQGSLLGSMLFLLFVDDLPNTVKTSRVACYADDTKIFKSIDSITDCNALQSDLTILTAGLNNRASYFISQCKYQCNTCKKITCTAHLYYQRNAFGILRFRERPWCVSDRQSYLGQTSDWTVCESQQTPRPCAPSF